MPDTVESVHVLIIDEDLARAVDVRKQTIALGHPATVIAQSIVAALALIAHERFDVVVVNPVWPSDPISRVLRQQCDHRGYDPIFVCLSARNDVRPPGFDVYLLWPFMRVQLDQALRATHSTN